MTETIEKLLGQWINATETLKVARSAVIREECHLRNAESALAKRLIPQGAQPGEKFAVWVGDSMVQVTINPSIGCDPTLTIRNRPK